MKWEIGWPDGYRVKWFPRSLYEPGVETMLLVLVYVKCLEQSTRIVVKYFLNWDSVGCFLVALVVGKSVFRPELVHSSRQSEASLRVCSIRIYLLNSV